MACHTNPKDRSKPPFPFFGVAPQCHYYSVCIDSNMYTDDQCRLGVPVVKSTTRGTDITGLRVFDKLTCNHGNTRQQLVGCEINSQRFKTAALF